VPAATAGTFYDRSAEKEIDNDTKYDTIYTRMSKKEKHYKGSARIQNMFCLMKLRRFYFVSALRKDK